MRLRLVRALTWARGWQVSEPARVDQAFSIPVITVQVSEWATKKPQLLALVDWDDESCKKTDQFTDYYRHGDRPPYLNDFFDTLRHEVEIVAQIVRASLSVTSLWAQRYTRSQYMGPHNHGAVGYSAVLYAEYDPDAHTGTQFISPFNNFTNGQSMTYTPKVKEGDLIVFPSALLHSALPNESKKQRTIFSFNFLTE